MNRKYNKIKIKNFYIIYQQKKYHFIELIIFSMYLPNVDDNVFKIIFVLIIIDRLLFRIFTY